MACNSDGQAMRWVLDSGASRHMTSNKHALFNVHPLEESITITFGNGGTGKATAVGEHTPQHTFHLTDVLLIPQATENLISVRHAAKRGVEFKFCADRCEIGHGGRKLASAPSMGDASMVNGMHTTTEEFKAAGSEGNALCEPCVLGKQHRNPFKPSASVAARPLALVHTDLCGPLPVTSMGGSNYFVTLLDDYSKFSVVQPLTHKSDTAAAMKSTLIMLETQTGVRVQRLRCDNGSEYINADLTAFCREKGIKLETTVRYTPEQNSAAERLNRTLMDKVRPMLAASGLPKYLWAEAAVTANYVRNRSPVTGHEQTTYELFFGSKPDVSNLRVWGARAYALTPKQLRNKLQNTSEPGHFIGYPAGTKGYKLLLDDGRIVISRDLTFVEAGGTRPPDPETIVYAMRRKRRMTLNPWEMDRKMARPWMRVGLGLQLAAQVASLPHLLANAQSEQLQKFLTQSGAMRDT
jgi:hypothetical protein